MLNERVLRKTATQLKDLGWENSEIEQALSVMTSGNKNKLNIVMPAHLKKEAMQHAKCTCLYVMHLSPHSHEYEKEFKKAYKTYLIEAWMNSKGIESEDDIKRSNPAGIEVNVFEALEKKYQMQDLVPNKDTIKKKAPIGIVYMGKDKYLQKLMLELYQQLTESARPNDPKNLVRPEMSPENAKELIKSIITQYSAAVTSLGNTFLYAFGNYNTKRKFSGVPIYDQVDGVLKQKRKQSEVSAAKTLEFTKLSKSPSSNEKEALREVTYRQMTRQIYLYVFSSIVAGVGALNAETINNIEEGVKIICEKLWANEVRNDASLGQEIPLAFLLQKDVREIVLQEFFNSYSNKITEYGPNQTPSIRHQYLLQIREAIEKFKTEVASGKKVFSSKKRLYSPSNAGKKKSAIVNP